MKRYILKILFAMALIVFSGSLQASQLYEAIITPESKEDSVSGIKSLELKSTRKDWTARFVEGERDIDAISTILLQQSPEKRIYLPTPTDKTKILAWQKRAIDRQPYYRHLIVEGKKEGKDQALAVIEMHTMPRAVSFLDDASLAGKGCYSKEQPGETDQSGILQYYHDKGLISYDAANTVEALRTEAGGSYTFGKYRPLKDSGMLRIRVMPHSSVANDVDFLADVINGVSSLVKVFSKEFPLHAYPTDREPGKPKVIMSYTALEEGLRKAYVRAGFSLDETPIFEGFWDPESRSKLPSKPVVAMQPLSNINPDTIKLRLIETSMKTEKN